MSGSLREDFTRILLEQVRSCRYPSPTMMDRIEAAVGDRRAAEEYVGSLLEMLAADRYPSPQMLDRVSGLLEVLEPRPR